MDLQKRYDELDNIISTLSALIDEIEDKDYIEEFNYIKFRAQDELNEVDTELQKEYDREEEEMNRQYIHERI